MVKKKYGYILLFFLSCIGCLEIEDIPNTPHVEFRRFEVIDSSAFYSGNAEFYKYLGFFTFYFEDGDGNVGMSPDSSARNLYFSVYEKINGEYIPITDEKILAAFSYQIPNMEAAGKNKTLSGEITVRMILRSLKNKYIRFDYYILDQEDNKSNIGTSPELLVSPGFTTDSLKNTNF